MANVFSPLVCPENTRATIYVKIIPSSVKMVNTNTMANAKMIPKKPAAIMTMIATHVQTGSKQNVKIDNVSSPNALKAKLYTIIHVLSRSPQTSPFPKMSSPRQ